MPRRRRPALDRAERVGVEGQRPRAVTRASSWRSEPAAPLRGLASVRSPRSRARSLKASKPARGMYTSPRTSSTGPRCPCAAQAQRDRAHGAQVRADVLAVLPSPRVAPRTNTPSS
jgi:hypothetical protein